MRIGYPCINRSIDCLGDRTFRLKSYSEQRLVEVVGNNLACAEKMVRFNIEHGMGFLRLSSGLVPFASHPVCTFDWQLHFQGHLRRLGCLIRRHGMRISMHPDQFTLLNSPDENIFARSAAELRYHAEVLDGMGLGLDAKIQIHVGGVYGDRAAAIRRFVERYARVDDPIRRRLVIENDDRCYPVSDCLRIHEATGVPVLFDVFHHALLGDGETVAGVLARVSPTWGRADGPPMLDYSSQQAGARPGVHAEHIDAADFRRFLRLSRPYDFDVMLEIKDKERSAAVAVAAAGRDPRFSRPDGGIG